MENLYYNLSEEEFTKGRKILLWVFAGLFFLGGIYVLIISLVLGHKSINAILSAAPFGISLIITVFAFFATIKRNDTFFSIDNDKVEFRYGLIKPKKHSFNWADVNEVIMPHKQKKVKFLFANNTFMIVNLTWLQKKKSSHLRKHLFYVAKEKNIKITKVSILPK
jgi:hypothetical protein